jgi:predicted branched-subunit amino acid permease
MTTTFTVNGRAASTDAPPATPLLWVIREGLKLTGTKFGCGHPMSGHIPESHRLERPRFTARGVWRGSVEIAPIAAFVIPFGIAFGVAASAKGISPEISVFMSVAIFAGASQFAVLDLWYAPLPLATLALTVLAVNARHILLGAALAPWLLQVPIVRRLAALLLLTDANFAYAMSARDRKETDAGILFGSGLTIWIMWIVSTAIGALTGSLLGDLSLRAVC